MARRKYIIGYDVRNIKRLRAIHKTLKSVGTPVQLSLWVSDLNTMELIVLKSKVFDLIKEDEDSIVFIDLGDESVSELSLDFLGVRPLMPKKGFRIV